MAQATQSDTVIPDTQADPDWIDFEETSFARSWVGAPIILEDQVIAFLELDSNKPGFYTRHHGEILALFANEAAIALENARLFEAERRQWKRAEAQAEELRQRERSLRLLNEITRVASKESEFTNLPQTLVDHLGALIKTDSCYIALWNEKERRLIPMAAYGPIKDHYAHLIFQTDEPTLASAVLDAGNSLVIEDISTSPIISPRILSLFPECSALGLPLITDERKLGVVIMAFNQLHTFTDDEISISEQAAQQLALAIVKSKALETAQRRAREAETLRQAGAAVAATLNQNEAIQLILEQLNDVVPYDSASVQLLRNGEMEIVGGRSFPDLSVILGRSFPLSGGNPSAHVFETRLPYILEDAQESYALFRLPPHDRVHGWMGVPLIVQDRIIGVISLDSLKPNTFTDDHARMAVAFADQVAIALENARMYHEVQRLAITDSLTSLFNRRHFIDLARLEFERARRYQHPLSAAMLDIDHFKRVNDTFGHQVGDQVLISLAKLCLNVLRKTDILGRYGGEEFVVLMPETDSDHAIQAAERLRLKIGETSIETDRGPILITASLGVSTIKDDVLRMDTPDNILDKLIDQADQALYAAKQAGLNQVAIWKK